MLIDFIRVQEQIIKFITLSLVCQYRLSVIDGTNTFASSSNTNSCARPELLAILVLTLPSDGIVDDLASQRWPDTILCRTEPTAREEVRNQSVSVTCRTQTDREDASIERTTGKAQTGSSRSTQRVAVDQNMVSKSTSETSSIGGHSDEKGTGDAILARRHRLHVCDI